MRTRSVSEGTADPNGALAHASGSHPCVTPNPKVEHGPIAVTLSHNAGECARRQNATATLSAPMLAPLSTLIAAAPSFADDLPAALPLQRLEILSFEGHFFARAKSGEWQGVAVLNHWTPALLSFWQEIVFPFWLGRDARQVAADTEAIGRADRNYKLAGTPFQMAVAGVELALWDLLGHAAKRPVAALFNPKPRARVPVYLSSLRRDTSAQAEVDWLSESIEKTGAKAVKIKIGGRLNWDEQTEARDRELLGLARQTWGDKFTIYVDANGSFEADKAIEVGQLLHEHRVAWFEEPCDWEDFEATRAVAAGVPLPVAGGEQDSSPHKWRWLLEHCALDVAQPDLSYNGGWLRCWQIADYAAQLEVTTTPHSPKSGAAALPALHFAAAIEKPAPFLEWDARLPALPSWLQTPLEVSRGAVSLPKGSGWGAQYDAEIWSRAEILAALSV